MASEPPREVDVEKLMEACLPAAIEGPLTAELVDESDPNSPVQLCDEHGNVRAVMSQKAFWFFRNGGKK